MFSTYIGQFESRKTKVELFLSFKLNTDSFIRSIYYNICVLISFKKMFEEIDLLGTKWATLKQIYQN